MVPRGSPSYGRYLKELDYIGFYSVDVSSGIGPLQKQL